MTDLSRSFEDMVREVIEDYEGNSQKKEIDADDIKDFGQVVEDIVSDMTIHVDADNINGLESAIEDFIKGCDNDVSDSVSKELESVLTDEVCQCLKESDEVQEAIRDFIVKDEAVKTYVKTVILEAISEVLTKLLKGNA